MPDLTTEEALAWAKQLHVRVDMWAFPGYTKINLLTQVVPGKGSWDAITGWTFEASVSAGEALVRALTDLDKHVANFHTGRRLVAQWNELVRGKGYPYPPGLEWETFEAQHQHEYIRLKEPSLV